MKADRADRGAEPIRDVWADAAVPRLPDSPVTKVECHVFRAAVSDGVAMAFAPLPYRAMAVVVIELADGHRGLGESWINYPAWAWRERIATVEEGVAPLIVGRSFETPVGAHDHLVATLSPLARQWGARGPICQAVSAVDAALWDIAAQHAGASLAAVLSDDPAKELRVYGSSLGPTGVEATAQHCRELGLTAVKVKLGFGRERDEGNLRLARDILGEGIEIFADANQAWSLDEALGMAPLLRELGVAWLEEPISGDDPDDLAKLRARGRVALATGENLYGAEGFAPHVARRSVDIVQPDISKVGGPTEYWRVSELAWHAGITVNPHLYNGSVATATTVQVAAAHPATGLVEWDVRVNPLRASLDHLLTDHGTVRVPSGTGLGIDVNLRALSDFAVTR